MDQKAIGGVLIAAGILIALVILLFQSELASHAEASCSCTEMQNGGFCPHEQSTPWQTYAGLVLTSGLAALGIYLIFFEKSYKEIASVLENQRKMQLDEERFAILLKGMDMDEQKVLKAVKEQDGITQQTLRLRTDLHKSKLSLVLDRLEKKGLVKKVAKGKTNQVFLSFRP